jgi:plastocyanin
MAVRRATVVALFCLLAVSSGEAANLTVTLTTTNTFEPQVATIRVGDTVTWVNPPASDHTT